MLYGLDHNGEGLWSNEVGDLVLEPVRLASPIVHQGVVLLSHDNEKYESFLMAVSAVDGKTKWQTVRKTQRTGYSTLSSMKPAREQLRLFLATLMKV